MLDHTLLRIKHELFVTAGTLCPFSTDYLTSAFHTEEPVSYKATHYSTQFVAAVTTDDSGVFPE